MTTDLSAARTQWLAEKSTYEALVAQVVSQLKSGCQQAGVFGWVTGRSKDTASLLKKLVTKGRRYDEITDKAGARVVVRFREDLAVAEQVVKDLFHVIQREDKSDKLGLNKLGYQAVHFDVVLSSAAITEERLPQCEIQVRTLCQNLWAEMDHQLSYKSAGDIDHDISRQINLLNALLELADRHFSSINELIRTQTGPAAQMLFSLEKHYYGFSARPYDPELTHESIQLLFPLYCGQPVQEILCGLNEFVDLNGAKLGHIYDQFEGTAEPPLFLNQPEVFMILQLLEKDEFRLDEQWCSAYPREELERVAIAWGAPLD